MPRLLVFLLAALLLALPARAETIEVTASTARLHDDRNVSAIGALDWRAGFSLTSDDADFGGLSDLAFTPDGRLLLAGDKGYWFDARPVMDDGRLAGLSDVRKGAYRKLDGEPVTLGRHKDGESLTLIDGVPVVGFEQLHRLRAYPTASRGPAPTKGRSRCCSWPTAACCCWSKRVWPTATGTIPAGCAGPTAAGVHSASPAGRAISRPALRSCRAATSWC